MDVQHFRYIYYFDHKNRFNRNFACHLKNYIEYAEERPVSELSFCNNTNLKRSVMILCPETEDFIVFDFDDYAYINRPSKLAENSKCIAVFKSQYRTDFRDYYERFSSPVVPFTYFERFSVDFQRNIYGKYRDNLKKPSERKDNGVFFKGVGNYGRNDILNRSSSVNKDVEKVSYKKYFKQLSEAYVALSLPGGGDVNHREIECFALKTPVMRPLFRNEMYSPLVPFTHYIPLTCNRNNLPLDIDLSYDKIRVNDDMLDSIAENAFQWYENNVLYPSFMSIVEGTLSYIMKEHKS